MYVIGGGQISPQQRAVFKVKIASFKYDFHKDITKSSRFFYKPG